MKLSSSKYGIGTLISEENGRAKVEFNGKVIELIVKFAKLTNEDGTLYEGTTGDVVVVESTKKVYKNRPCKNDPKAHQLCQSMIHEALKAEYGSQYSFTELKRLNQI